MMRRSTLVLAALTLATTVLPVYPSALPCARAEPAAQPSPAEAKRMHADAQKRGRHRAAPSDDANRGASTSRRHDDPTRGRSTGDAKQSGPGSGAGL